MLLTQQISAFQQRLVADLPPEEGKQRIKLISHDYCKALQKYLV